MTAAVRTARPGKTAEPASKPARRRKAAPPPPPPPVPVDEVTEDWLAHVRLEVLQCRDLRHSWPRQPVNTTRNRRRAAAAIASGLPLETDNIVWRVLEKGPPTTLERTMTCTGGCEVRRVETFVVRDGGRLVRPGRPRMRYPKDYKRPRVDDDAPPLQALDVDVLRGSIIARLVPGLQW